jgi:hypothetical protein
MTLANRTSAATREERFARLGLFVHEVHAGIGGLIVNRLHALQVQRARVFDLAVGDRVCITIAEALKPLGYATGHFGKNHLGDRDEFLPTNHGFDEFFGNLYHLNAEQELEMPYWPKDDPVLLKVYAPRGVIHDCAGTGCCW